MKFLKLLLLTTLLTTFAYGGTPFKYTNDHGVIFTDVDVSILKKGDYLNITGYLEFETIEGQFLISYTNKKGLRSVYSKTGAGFVLYKYTIELYGPFFIKGVPSRYINLEFQKWINFDK